MDLSLRGSQINLIERCKKPINFSVHTTLRKYHRPYSASALIDRSTSRLSQNSSSLPSSYLQHNRYQRPMSADEKLAQSIRNYVRFSEQKKFSSVNINSSNLLKFLLNEPIRKRSSSSLSSCLYHRSNNYDDRSDVNLKARKIQRKFINSNCIKRNLLKKNHKRNFNDVNTNIEDNLRSSSEEQELESLDIDEIRCHNVSSLTEYRSNASTENNVHKDFKLRLVLHLNRFISKSKFRTISRLMPPKKQLTNFKKSNFKNFSSSNRMSYSNSNKYSKNYSTYSQVESSINTGGGGDDRPGGRGDYWHSRKPDLPGRVSFGKSNVNTVEIDYSDCENDTSNNRLIDNERLSPTSGYNRTITETITAGVSSSVVSKKSVHFGDRTEPHQQQQHQSSSASSSTCHQYTSSSCSNEPCTCVCNKKIPSIKPISSTLPTSSSSIKCADNKCSFSNDCYDTTDFNKNYSHFPSSTTVPDDSEKLGKFKDEEKCLKDSIEDENKIIKKYKDESRKLKLEMETTEDKDKDIDCSKNQQAESSTYPNSTETTKSRISSYESTNKYDSDYTHTNNSLKLMIGQKGNNFSYLRQNEVSSTNSQNNYEKLLSSSTYKNSTSACLDDDQSNEDKTIQTSNPIINNYLKVSTSSQMIPSSQESSETQIRAVEKKLNNNPDNMAINTVRKSKKFPSSISSNSSKKSSRSKSVSPSTSNVQLATSKKQKNLKKSETLSCLRQDSNLNEFNLDNIDTWMAIQYRENDESCTTNYNHQKHEHQSLHHHHYHYHQDQQQNCCKNKSGASSSGSGVGGNLKNKGCTKHCHRVSSSEKYESHEDTDTPDQCFKTTEESSSSSSSQDSGGGSSSTYDEIVSVIKEIEEDKKKEIPQDSSDLDIKFQNMFQSDMSDISTVRKNESESPDKLKDILSYLEDVENSCERTLMETRRSMPETTRSEVEFAVEPDIAENVPKIADLLMLPNHQLARRIVALSLRSNELSNAILLSKEHLAQLRQEKQKLIRLEKQNATNRLREQKKHYENMLARHQGFIEQLLKDKGSLCEKVTALTRRLESQNQAWEHKLETETARAREIAIAGEKIRRERWVRENTRKIKELTVKGIEAEIEKINSDHHREITDLKKLHQQELLNALEEARQKHEQVEKSIRESCAKDRETIIEKERKAIRERFERQLQEELKSFDEQKSKLIEDFAAERERLLKELKKKDEELEKRKCELQREKEIAVEQAISECNEKLEQQEQKHQTKINAIEKQFESDFLIWKKEFETACKLKEVENENSIRQHYRAERDRQIDAIVSRMDAESLKNQEEFELKFSRLKEKYEGDLKEAENAENSLREKYNEIRTRLAESDATVQNLQAEMKQLQLELDHSKKMCDEFLAEKETMKENIRNEVQIEIASIKSERDDEIEKIHKRVQQAIEKKDAAMEILHKDNIALRERCIKLEAIIRQQRKDYCMK